MAASDWDADPTNTADITFPDLGGGDHAMLMNLYPSGSPIVDIAHFILKTLGMKNTEFEFKYNLVAQEANENFLPMNFRWDRGVQAGGNGYKCYLRKYYDSGWRIQLRIYKSEDGVLTQLALSPYLAQWNMNFWRRVRIRVWDLVFPAGAVRFSMDYHDGANWVSLYTFTDVSGAFFNTTGRTGFGGIGGPGVINQYLYFNDMYVRW